MNYKVLFFLMLSFVLAANAVDQELATKLKSDLEFDVQRRNAFTKNDQAKKVYETEREKGLALYLEEQEKWDISREKGLREQRAHRAQNKEMSEQSPEYIQDQKEKNKYEASQENFRRRHVETKREIGQFFESKILVSEAVELGIHSDRPRFDLRDRGKSKWVKKGAGSSSGSSSSSAWGSGSSGGSSGESGSSAPFDYPVSGGGDYVPTDNFDDLPPPPPLVPYDSYGNGQGAPPPYYNEGNPDFPPAPGSPQGYPVPPPDGGWDF